MSALITFIKSSDTDQIYMAVIADESGAQYVWAPGVDPFWPNDAERLARLTDGRPEQPSTAEDWLSVATYHLGDVYWTPSREVADIDAGVAEAEAEFAELDEPVTNEDGDKTGSNVDLAESRVLGEAARAFDEVTEDYPELGEDDETDAQAMNNYVLSMLGPIDPEGPNGWILRAMDGNPRPGDEMMYVTLEQPVSSASEEA